MQEKFQERMTDFSGRKLSLQESQLDIRRTWNGGKGKDPGVDADMGLVGGTGGTGAGVGVDSEMGVVLGVGTGSGIGTGTGLEAAWMRRRTGVAGVGAGTDIGTDGAVTAPGAGTGAGTGTEVVFDMTSPSTVPYINHDIDGKDTAVESNTGDLRQADLPDISPLLLTSDYDNAAAGTATTTTATTTTAVAAAVSDLKRTEIVDRKCSADPSSPSSSSPSSSAKLAASIKHQSDTTTVSTNNSVGAGEGGVTSVSQSASGTIPSSSSSPSSSTSPPPSSSSPSSSSSSPSASPSADTDTHPTVNITPHNGDVEDSALSPFLTVQAGTKYVPSVFPYPVIPSHVTIEDNSSSNSSSSSSNSDSSSNSHSPSLPD